LFSLAWCVQHKKAATATATTFTTEITEHTKGGAKSFTATAHVDIKGTDGKAPTVQGNRI